MWQKICGVVVAVIIALLVFTYFYPSYAPEFLVNCLPVKPAPPAAAESYINKRYGVGTFEERYMPSRGTLLRPAAS